MLTPLSTTGLTLLPPQDVISQLPVAASTFADSHDTFFYLAYYVSVYFVLLVTGILVYSVLKYRRRSPDQAPVSLATRHPGLQVTFVVIPLVIAMAFFSLGWKGARDMIVAPADALQYSVEAKMLTPDEPWGWRFLHPPGNPDLDWKKKEFWVPMGKPCQLTMRSKDVLHSLSIPAFRIKHEILPGRYQSVWFRPTVVGDFDVFCTEYCGKDHFQMLGTVHVVSQQVFDTTPWRELPEDDAGKGKIFYQKNCMACHTTDSNRLLGPGFKGMYGRTETLTSGETIVVNDAYILKSIRNPTADIVQADPPYLPVMRQFVEDALSDEQVRWIIEYIKTLK